MKALKSLPTLIVIVAIAAVFGFKLTQQVASKLNPPANQIGTVIKVADGDTLTIDVDGRKEKIRLCGIDAPERSQALGEQSREALKKLALRKQVSFEKIERDRYDRIVAEVFVLGSSEIFVNANMVESGMAYHYEKYSNDCPNRDVIITAEAIAKQSRAGVWATTNSVKPWDYRQSINRK